jgi:peptidyl-prolyl cis-trans isomerase C
MNLHRLHLLPPVVVFATLALAACNKAPPGEAEKPAADRVATVNGKPLSRAEFDLYVDTVSRQSGREISAEERGQLLDQYIGMKLAEEMAEKEGATKDPKVADQLAQARTNVLVDAHLQNYLKAHPVTDEEMKKEYDGQVAQLPKEYHARHILVDDKAAADAITKQLKEGADFAKLAKQKSKDPSGKSGGDLGWFSPGSMVKPFADAVVALEPGQTTDQPVQSQFGWHVIKLEESRATAAPPYEDVKDRVRVFVQRKKLQTYIDDLRKNAKVEKNEKTA